MAQERPNIILYTTDQHRGDYLGLADHPVLRTPNIDALAEHGAYFPNAYTEIPSTTGARRCLHLGQRSYDCGLIGYGGNPWKNELTIAKVLADAGYHCLNVGWRNMRPPRKLFGFHQAVIHDIREGLDDYMEWLKREVGPWAEERGHGVDANGWTARPFHLEERYHPTVWTTNVALDVLRKRDPTKPFFIWISHLYPHSPYTPPQVYWDMYINEELPEIPVGDWAERYDVPNPGLSRTAWFGRLTPDQDQRGRAGYMGVITHIDDQLGFLSEQLKRIGKGEFDRSMVIFTADHGDMLGDHHLHRKTYPFEGSARIPFVVKYPASMDMPSGAFENVVGLQDVMPTILEAAGVEAPETVTGRSVFEAVRGQPWREFFHGEHSCCYDDTNAWQYLTDGREKYAWNPMTDEEFLFDLRGDRHELHNLATEKTGSLRSWRRRLIDLLGKRGDGFSDGKRLIKREEPYGPVVGNAGPDEPV